MLITIKTLTGRKINYTSDDDAIIRNIKEFLQEKEGIELSQIRLIYGGKQLNDMGKVINELKPGDVVHMVLALRGGAGTNPGFQAFLDLKKKIAGKLGIPNSPNAGKVAGEVQREIKEKNEGMDAVEVSKKAYELFEANIEKYSKLINIDYKVDSKKASKKASKSDESIDKVNLQRNIYNMQKNMDEMQKKLDEMRLNMANILLKEDECTLNVPFN